MEKLGIKETYLLFLIVIGLVSLSLYSTYALFTASTEITDVVNFTTSLTTESSILEYEMVTIPAGESKVIELVVTNSHTDTIYYGAWYQALTDVSDISIGIYSDENNTPASGTIAASGSLTILIGITNNGTSDAILNVGIVGSENSNLNLSDSRILITDEWSAAVLLSDAIMSLTSTSACDAGGSGVCATNDNQDYRYRGTNVKNYVWFNNDMYRIIGVFDENTHGVEGQYLTKLISANRIGNHSWGVYNTSNTSGTFSSYKSDWTGNTTGVKANLNVLLNEYFYNKTDTSTTYGDCESWTYYLGGENYRTNDCTNILGYGIDSSLRNYIEDVTWHLYTANDYLSKQNWYLCERGQYSGCTSGNDGAYDTSTVSKIGLMYASDYMYASGYYSVDDTTTDDSYYYGNKNWLFSGFEWIITPLSEEDTYFIYDDSSLYYTYTYESNKFRPTFYLKESIYVTGGDGSFDNPYTISI